MASSFPDSEGGKLAGMGVGVGIGALAGSGVGDAVGAEVSVGEGVFAGMVASGGIAVGVAAGAGVGSGLADCATAGAPVRMGCGVTTAATGDWMTTTPAGSSDWLPSPHVARNKPASAAKHAPSAVLRTPSRKPRRTAMTMRGEPSFVYSLTV